jgi:hypothetical protein
MKYFLVIVALVLIFLGYRHFSSGAKPSADDVEPLLNTYLVTDKKGTCTVTHLSDISIGDFSEQFEGWAVYASTEVTCHDGNTTGTYNGLDHAKERVAEAFARRTVTGAVELFIPQLFKDAERQINEDVQRQMQGALDGAQTN